MYEAVVFFLKRKEGKEMGKRRKGCYKMFLRSTSQQRKSRNNNSNDKVSFTYEILYYFYFFPTLGFRYLIGQITPNLFSPLTLVMDNVIS